VTGGPALSAAPSARVRALGAAGLVLAVLAELCATGLIGLSGWFISACAVAGAAAFSSFSYLAPSGGVRTFALGRIAGNYSQRLVLHAAAFGRVAAARARFFDTVSRDRAQPRSVWSGELLDRSLADTDTVGMALIRSTAPVTVTVSLTAGGVLAVALAASVPAAAVLAVGVTLLAAVAYLIPDPTGDAGQRTRAALRSELVTAVDAWPEMATLGAAGRLAARTTADLTRLSAARSAVHRHRRRMGLLAGTLGLGTLTGTVAVTLGSVGGPADLVFVALLAAGVLAQAEQLSAAAEARASAVAALRRLTLPAAADAPVADAVPEVRTTATAGALRLDGYRLPATVLRPEQTLDACVTRGGVLAVTGRSGSGKSTLLRGLARSLRSTVDPCDGRPPVTAVAADEHLFTGTVGANFRLADPTLTDEDVDVRLAELWLDRTGLTAGTLIGPGGRTLSGGELRRVSVGRALATRPHVLVVDEPTAGLDQETARHVLRTLAQLPDTTVVLAVHDLPDALKPAGQVAILSLD
jgi:ATP-binding cassette, subfamily C, bacterial CydC